MVKFSIITVVYNGEAFIESTLRSIYDQTYNNFEHIVVDGNSTDNTLAIVEKYKTNNMVVISESDSGIYDAMNKGIDKAVGDYIIFINAGDSFANNHTLRDYSLVMDGENLFYGDSYRVYKDRRSYKKEIVDRFSITRHNICHQSIFYPSRILKEVKYDLNYPLFADWVTNIKIMSLIKFKHIEIPVCNFNMDGVSSTSDRFKDPKFIQDLPALTYKYLGFLPFVYVSTRFLIRRLCTI